MGTLYAKQTPITPPTWLRFFAGAVPKNPGLSRSSVSAIYTGPQFCHRMLGTCYLIQRQVRGHTSFGEHLMATGQAPVSVRELECRFQKVPDGLVLLPGAERGYAGGRQIGAFANNLGARVRCCVAPILGLSHATTEFLRAEHRAWLAQSSSVRPRSPAARPSSPHRVLSPPADRS